MLAIPFVYFCVKETKGLSLEEIDLLFAKKEYRHVLEARLRGDGSNRDGKEEIEMVEEVDIKT